MASNLKLCKNDQCIQHWSGNNKEIFPGSFEAPKTELTSRRKTTASPSMCLIRTDSPLRQEPHGLSVAQKGRTLNISTCALLMLP